MAKLFSLPQQYVPERSGVPMMGAQLWFYEVGTSTPKDTFNGSDLLTANTNPVVADQYGIFSQIWLDNSGLDYRVILRDSEDLVRSIVDGLIGDDTSSTTLANLLLIDGAGSGLDADFLDGFDSSEFAIKAFDESITGAWNFTARPSINGEGMGYVNIPVVEKSAAYTLLAEDRGKDISISSGGVLIPIATAPGNVIAVGSTYCIYNDSTSTQTVDADNPGVTLIRLAGTIVTGARTIAARGLVVCHKIKDEEWLVYGPGVG
jgi:hypothetical protein